MGLPAGLLAIVHIMGCAAVAFFGWLYWALSISEGNTPGSEPYFLVLGIPLLVAAVVMYATLLLGRRLLAAGVLGIELVLGVAIVMRALDESVHSDQWIWVTVLVIAGSGIGALAAAEPGQRRLAG